MKSIQIDEKIKSWKFNKVGVIGPGIVGMPMAALIANSFLKSDDSKKGEVIVVQRESRFSGWKVESINSGKSVIGGIEPDLDIIVSDTVAGGTLRATHNYSELCDADAILVCVQTDKKGLVPDYEPLFDALNVLAAQLKNKPADKVPLVIIESTLAPSSMHTVIKPIFSKYNLEDGLDILLGNSPNRVMPGRLIERIKGSDKIVAGLNPLTPQLIKKLYSRFVEVNLFDTNSLTAEVVKTLENAYRDVRIAFASEMVRYCDELGIDFYYLRGEINKRINQTDNASDNPNEVPSGGILIPTIGVGGHCLPKDGILLWWRMLENKVDSSSSLILNSRKINEESPSETIRHAEKRFGMLNGKKITLLGAAYRFNSEDTRNSPALVLAKLLLMKNCDIKIHDTYVKIGDQNILKFELSNHFTNDLIEALEQSEFIFVCTAHYFYFEKIALIREISKNLIGLIDGCNLYSKTQFISDSFEYTGIGKGNLMPEKSLVDHFYNSFLSLEKGFANELQQIIEYLNKHHAQDDFNRIHFHEVQKLAGSCCTRCEIANPGPINTTNSYQGYKSVLVKCAEKALQKSQSD